MAAGQTRPLAPGAEFTHVRAVIFSPPTRKEKYEQRLAVIKLTPMRLLDSIECRGRVRDGRAIPD